MPAVKLGKNVKRKFIPMLSLLVLTALVVYSEYLKGSDRPDSDRSRSKSPAVSDLKNTVERGSKVRAARKVDADLLRAAAWGHTSRLLVLLNAGANVNVRDDNDDTPLLLAAAYGHAETVEALLALGADINAKNDTGNTALIEAVASNRLEIVKILIEKKADVKARNIAGSSAVDVAREKALPDIRQMLTRRASAKSLRYFNSPEAIANILALHEAALEGNTQRITSLLAQGSDVNARDANGRTALMIAASTNKTKVVDLLLAKGANPNMTDYKEGRTALIVAAEAGYDEVARSLLNGGANPNLKDRFGETAMSSAQRLNRLHIGRLLKQAGVNTPSYDQVLPRP